MFRNHKLNIGYVLAMVSICVAFWAYAIMVPTRAAYRTESNRGAIARVAKFSVTQDVVLCSGDAVLDCNIPGDEVTYELTVHNESEVDVDYRISVTGYGDNVLCMADSAEGSLAANGASANARLTFRIVDPENKTQAVSLNQIVVTVIAEQRQGGTP